MATPQHLVADGGKRFQGALCGVFRRGVLGGHPSLDAGIRVYAHLFTDIRTQDRRDSLCALAFLRAPSLDNVYRNCKEFLRYHRKE